ncbi:hypothetical protein [Labedaea rhizosphaerae]|uniref:Uncharacterized protein n=1 Tax=Labedaea rhizosphaerae TaxID=598644 RepID=A0A4R6S4T9_LABRH|nr:hypothetical protein [Labedaea rhizosphaerae]TDP94779.1 hypothetical protein EV186_10511 [Labedaea rhizosphaerae]
MPGDSLKDLTEVFTRRFLLNALLPTFVFAAATATLIVHSTAGLPAAAAWWGRLDALTKIAMALLVAVCTFFLSSAVASQWRGLIRLYEGYPLVGLLGRFQRSAPGISAHEARRARLADTSRAEVTDQYYRYPPEDTDEGPIPVLPTRLGNILLAGEYYSTDHYKIDCVVFWPRLFPLLPPAFRTNYQAAQANAEFPLVVSFEAAVATVIGATAVLLGHGAPLLFAGVVLVGAALSYGAYVTALTGATELAEQQRTAWDLYRDRLLRQWPSVLDVRDEEEAFEHIYGFVVQGFRPQWDRPHRRYLRRHPAPPDQGD